MLPMTLTTPLPADETGRLDRLHALGVLDTPAEPLFDALVAAAAAATGTPISLVSLIDRDRQWFKANSGLPEATETPREVAFCAHAILGDDLLEVPDACQDPRFAQNPLVQGRPDIRFYAGAPIRLSDGHTMGTLCVIDRQPRWLDERQRSTLRHLAAAAARALEMRVVAQGAERALQSEAALLRRQAEDQARLQETLQATGAGTWRWAADSGELHLDERAQGLLGLGDAGQPFTMAQWLMQLHPDDQTATHLALAEHLQGQRESFAVEHRVLAADGRSRWLAAHGQCVTRPGLAAGPAARQVLGTLLDISARKQAELALAASEQRAQALYQTAPVMLHSADPQGHLLAVSDHWLARLGYSREEVLGRLATEFFAAESGRRAWSQEIPAFLATGRCERVPYEMVCKSGEVIEVELSAVLERDALGRPLHTTTVIEDVTARHRAERALRDSEALLNRTGRVADVGGWEIDLEGGALLWSHQTYELHGQDPHVEPDLERAMACYPPEARARLETALGHTLAGGPALDMVLPFQAPNTPMRWVHVVGQLQAASGGHQRLVGAIQDVTAHREAERALAESHELMRVTLRSIGDAVITTDLQGRVQWFNPAAERMTGWLTQEAQGKPLAQVFHILDEDSRQIGPNPVTECLAQRRMVSLAQHTVLVSRDGSERAIEDSAAPILNADGELVGAVLVFHDVTEQRALSREMTRRARHDALTGLLNRAEFEHRLQRLLEKVADEGGQHGLMFIDLDQFKLVNDACGHTAGDRLLRQMAELLGDAVRTRDTVARLGGDEFAVLLEHCPAADAEQVGQKICDRLDEFRFVHDDRRFRLGASIGLVPVDGRWRDMASLMQAADLACLAAKEAGRNRVHVWFETDQALQRRGFESQWAARLQQALEEDQFLLYGQRIAPLQAGAERGLHCELLLRLPDGAGGVIAPGAFMPAAERFHLATQIDRWVLRHAIDWLQADPQALASLGTLAINLSGQSVGDRAFHRFAVDLLAQAPQVQRKLCFEITETVAITRLADAATFIDQVRALGVRVALDDFGAGASSFGYLKSLPVDLLKIDGQFVRNMVADPLDGAAVRCFCEVAAVMGLQTVAECVENAEVLAALRGVGVHLAQGYHLHRPEPLAHLLARGALSVPA